MVKYHINGIVRTAENPYLCTMNVKLVSLLAFPAISATAADINIDSIRLANPSVLQAMSHHKTLDSLKAEAKRQLESRYGQHYGCASLSLTAICATLGGAPYTERQLRGLSDSFSGGIGHTFSEGTCGALSGAIMALGMYASGDKKLHQQMAAEVLEAFKKQEGTVKCCDIYGKYHFDRCDGCNLCAIQKVIEVLWNNGDIETSAVNPWEKNLQITDVKSK